MFFCSRFSAYVELPPLFIVSFCNHSVPSFAAITLLYFGINFHEKGEDIIKLHLSNSLVVLCDFSTTQRFNDSPAVFFLSVFIFNVPMYSNFSVEIMKFSVPESPFQISEAVNGVKIISSTISCGIAIESTRIGSCANRTVHPRCPRID